MRFDGKQLNCRIKYWVWHKIRNLQLLYIYRRATVEYISVLDLRCMVPKCEVIYRLVNPWQNIQTWVPGTLYRKWSLICRTQVIWLQNIIYLTPHSREISVVWSRVVSRVATKCCQHDGRYTCWVCQVMLNTSTLSLYIAA